MECVYIDTRQGQIPQAYAVSVTKAEHGIVLRYAAELPEIPERTDLMIVDCTGYSANSSAGFCEVVTPLDSGQIVGELTLDSGLRPVSPRPVVIFEDVHWRKIKTHKNRNESTSVAAYHYLKDAYKYKCCALVMGGQSDVTAASVVTGTYYHYTCLDIPSEHRTDIIYPLASRAIAVMEKHYWRYYGEDIQYPTPKQQKHDELRGRAIAYLLGFNDFGDIMTPDLAREIVRRLSSKGDDVSYAATVYYEKIGDYYYSEGGQQKIIEKAKAVLAEILPDILVDAVHVGDETGRTYTWVVPEGMQVSVGDTVFADTEYGSAEVVVQRVYRGLPRNHKYLIPGAVAHVDPA